MLKYLYLILLLFPIGLFSQSISGIVTNTNNEPLIGATVYWLGSTIGTFAGSNGEFRITTKSLNNEVLIASFVGHTADTLKITNQNFVKFRLNEIKILDEVVITGKHDGIIISNVTPIKTEIITQAELQKAACCDLAGCFETQSSVQPQTTNVITNSKELRILGLSGVYNQVLIDGFPMIQALTYTYGISGIPGTLVKNIHVSKGANSVAQGYSSISGQINVETKEPNESDNLLLNLYVNSFVEKHLNAIYAFKRGNWSNITAVSTVQPANKVDRDKDSFLDLPLITRYAISNKLKYGNERDWGWSSIVGLRTINEQRVGGQTYFNSKTDKGSSIVYGQTVNYYQPEAWAKIAYRFNDNHRLVLLTSSFHQNQKSYFGLVKYDAQQTNFYANLQYELNYMQKHSLYVGVSYRYQNLIEDISFTDTTLQRTYAGNYKKLESIPGAFVENTMYLIDDKLIWIAGLRGDQHNEFGFTVTPRTLLKYDFTEQTTIRASIGTGWRTVNLFSENIGLLVSSRNIIFVEPLKPERATNMGINFTHKFERANVSGYLSVDYYRTNFQNQVFPDYDTDPTIVIIKNFNGKSLSNGFQAEIYLKIREQFEVKTGYNYLDVYRIINEVKQVLPFNSTHKVLLTFGYKPLSNKYHFDINIHWYGEQRLPDTKSNPVEFQRPDYSKPYTLINAQFTYNIRRFEVYTGCENIFDFRQKRPIISWQNPFGPYFDTSSVWGPTKGREFYVGARFMLTNK